MPSFYSGLGPVMGFLMWAAGFVVLFLVLRTVVLWYWKIDRIVELLEEISNSLKNKPKNEENNVKI